MHLTGSIHTPGTYHSARFTAILVAALLILSGVIFLRLSRSSPEIRVVLFIVVDQLPAEYLQRFSPLLRGGLKTLSEQGARLTRTYHEHATTETCPGHATVVSGVHPRRHGIVANEWYDSSHRKNVGCVYDQASGASPLHLQASTLPDWLKRAQSGSRSFALSGKDRSAIMLGGKSADAALWYNNRSGKIVSSSYYSKQARELADHLSEARAASRYYGTVWEPLFNPLSLDPALGIRYLDEGVFQDRFPRPLGGPSLVPDGSYFDAIYSSPFQDVVIGDATRTLLRREQIGMRGYTDFLAVSFSALDVVGHRFGPNSPEILDVFLRVDQVIGQVIDETFDAVGKDKVLVVLTSDHGIPPLPEYPRPGDRGDRVRAPTITCLQNVHKNIEETFGAGPWFDRELTIAADAQEKLADRYPEFEQLTKTLISACPLVGGVWSGTDLANKTAPQDEIARRVWNNYWPGRSPNLTIIPKPYVLNSSFRSLNHGSPYDYDAHVPFILLGPGLEAKEVPERTATIDIAPTIADYLEIEYPSNLDGISKLPLLMTREK